jgi:hypothetical protein
MTLRLPAVTLLGLALVACTTAPPPPAPPVASSSTVALVAALTPTLGVLPPHAATRSAYLAFDSTHNGALGPDEWRRASAALFSAADKNHNAAIEYAELGNNALVREGFPSFDTDRDGKLTLPEFLALRETILRAADIDGNAYITFVEYELLVLLRRTGWMDRNRDGRIQMFELGAILGRAFGLLDTDHDGRLSRGESGFLAPAHRAAIDPASTGLITPDQLVNGYRFLLGADQVNRNLVPRTVPLKK